MVVDGVGDLMSTIARCCRPVPPEEILGYITLGRGVSIHRASCANLVRLRDVNPQRVLAVDWGRASPERTFPVAVMIEAFDRRGLVRDISGVLADEHISIEAMNSTANEDNIALVDVTVKVHGLDELSRLLSRFSSLPNVIRARRKL
jgi:GTP pyrophosphokinase